MYEGLSRLSVVRRTEPRADAREERGGNGRCSLFDERGVIGPIVLSQQIDTHDDTVLAKGKSLYAVIAGRTQRFAASVAIHDRSVLGVIGTIHYFFSSLSTKVVPVTGSAFGAAGGVPPPFHASALCL